MLVNYIKVWYIHIMKLCYKCRKILPILQFYKNKCSSDGLQTICILCTKENGKKARIKNVEYYKEKNKQWMKDHRIERNRYVRERRKDFNVRLAGNLRNRLRSALRDNLRTGSAIDNLGCSVDTLKQYLESKFQPGMTWENYGPKGWHIDHIKPLASFDLTDVKQLKIACHYTNLQPLWAKDNLKKNKLILDINTKL